VLQFKLPRALLGLPVVVTVLGLAATPVEVQAPEVVPYSKVTVVLAPLAAIVLLSVAPVVLMPVAAPVVTVGAHAAVVKLSSLPFKAPALFSPLARKKYRVLHTRPATASVEVPVVFTGLPVVASWLADE
jgi:hypothetical protein